MKSSNWAILEPIPPFCSLKSQPVGTIQILYYSMTVNIRYQHWLCSASWDCTTPTYLHIPAQSDLRKGDADHTASKAAEEIHLVWWEDADFRQGVTMVGVWLENVGNSENPNEIRRFCNIYMYASLPMQPVVKYFLRMINTHSMKGRASAEWTGDQVLRNDII